jgi:hypothetical protein
LPAVRLASAESGGLDQVLDAVVRAADAALYRAKADGRDRAFHAGTFTIVWSGDPRSGRAWASRFRDSAVRQAADGMR